MALTGRLEQQYTPRGPQSRMYADRGSIQHTTMKDYYYFKYLVNQLSLLKFGK
jgi:hypothetical protein